MSSEMAAAAVVQEIPENTNRRLVSSSDIALEDQTRWRRQRTCSWRPTSERLLEAAEARILQLIKTHYESKYIPLEGNKKIWTVKFNPNATKVPLVMIHGFGAGLGFWAINVDALARERTVYAFDVLGFGRSSRPHFSTKPEEAESQFVESIEQWRHQLGLEKFVLLGHSFGGYLASAYTLKHPSRIQHLVLVDSWGFPEKPSELEFTVPWWIKALATVTSFFNPLAGIRAAGPWGPSLVQRFRPDLQSRYSRLLSDDSDDTIHNYIYHCNAQKPSGETAFKNMNVSYGWAKFPMIHRIANMDKNIPITMVHGGESWISIDSSYETKHLRKDSYVDIKVIPHAGHHIYADQPDAFNQLVDKICQKEDRKINAVTH